MKTFLLSAIVALSIISTQAFAMTKGELKNILGVLDAAGVPDSALVQKAGVTLTLSPVSLANAPGIVYTLDAEGHWQASSGPATSVTAISFQ